MKTLWVFGDSYADGSHAQYSYEPLQYYSLIKNHYDIPMKNFGWRGSALDYTYCKFNENRYDFKPSDIIIICLTDFDRQWFFNEKPHITSLRMIEDSGLCDNTEIKIAKDYYKYTHNDQLMRVRLDNFLYAVNQITERVGLTTICLFCFNDSRRYIFQKNFPSIIFGNGSLSDLSIREYESEELKDKLIFDDFRDNHFCYSNHAIIAERLINAIDTGRIPNLINGFVSSILTKESILNDSLIGTEVIDSPLLQKIKKRL